MKKFLCELFVLFLILTLAACSVESDSVSERQPPQDESVDKSSIQGQTITAKAISYADQQLTFEYEGKKYNLPLSGEDFTDEEFAICRMKMISEQIINNRLNETVTAEMLVNEDITKIYKCDVINPNGMIFLPGMSDSEPEDIKIQNEDPDAWEKYAYTLTKIEGTKYKLSNIKRTLSVDLNDLQIHEKVIYPDSAFDVMFYGYMFEDGKFIINQLQLFADVNKEEGTRHYSNKTNLDYPNFFGTVQSYDGKTANILLTDGKTSINVPTYYCEEELSLGQEVMITLDCGTDLFGSGENRTFDYAVIRTDSKLYNYDNYDFSTLAYATSNDNTLGAFDYIFIDEVQP